MLLGIPIGLLHKIANVCNQVQVTVLENSGSVDFLLNPIVNTMILTKSDSDLEMFFKW